MMDNAIRVIEDEGEFIAFCRDDIPIGDALCVDEYQMAEQYTKIERELEEARAEIERLHKRVRLEDYEIAVKEANTLRTDLSDLLDDNAKGKRRRCLPSA